MIIIIKIKGNDDCYDNISSNYDKINNIDYNTFAIHNNVSNYINDADMLLLLLVLRWVITSHINQWAWLPMMTSSNGNIFRVTGPLCGEFTGDRWLPRTKASDAELWCFLWCAPEYTVD